MLHYYVTLAIHQTVCVYCFNMQCVSTTSTFICFIGCSVEGQVQQTCRTCPATCSNPALICRAVCEFGCGCPSGQLIDTSINKCVDPQDCPENCSVSS